jgi:hypothetical protein
MNDETESRQGPRATLVAVALVVMFGIPCTGFLIAATEGYVLVALVVVAVIGAVAGMHYLLWGRSMTQRTAGEREEAELRETLEANEWDLPDTRPGHYR